MECFSLVPLERIARNRESERAMVYRSNCHWWFWSTLVYSSTISLCTYFSSALHQVGSPSIFALCMLMDVVFTTPISSECFFYFLFFQPHWHQVDERVWKGVCRISQCGYDGIWGFMMHHDDGQRFFTWGTWSVVWLGLWGLFCLFRMQWRRKIIGDGYGMDGGKIERCVSWRGVVGRRGLEGKGKLYLRVATALAEIEGRAGFEFLLFAETLL